MPIRTRDEMRRAISGSAQLAQPTWAPVDERQIYLQRQAAAMGGGRGAGGRMQAERMGPYVPAGMAGAGGLIGPAAPTLGSVQPPVVQRAVVAPGPGQGAPAAVVTPASRARAEALNTASQQAGGPNLSQALVPKEREAAAKEFAVAREANPLAAVPEAIDQRSAQYAKGADIAAWIEANKNAPKGADGMNIVQRFLAKQRKAGPEAMEQGGAGLRSSYGRDLDVGPDEKVAAGVPYRGGVQQPSAEEVQAAFAREAATGRGGSLEGLAYEGPAPMRLPEAMAADAAGQELAFAMAAKAVPQATGQQSNLNGYESPLPSANAAQAEKAAKDQWLMRTGLPVLDKYKAMALNTYWGG